MFMKLSFPGKVGATGNYSATITNFTAHPNKTMETDSHFGDTRMDISSLETPAAIVDLDKLQANITKLQNYLDRHGIANRPHIKTHKIPEIAHMQLKAGATGITCQKLGEAEVMAQAGIDDIFLPYNILGKSKLERLMRLARRLTIKVTADSQVVVQGLAQAAQKEALILPVLVEFDTGLGRCGVQTPQATADLAAFIAQAPGLRFGGLMTYPSNEQTGSFVRRTKERLQTAGIHVDVVSGGGTPRMWQAHTHTEVSEHRAGTYVYGDRAIVRSGAMSFADCAFSVICTIVSRPTAVRGIIDGGSKTFSSDLSGLEGHGYILEYPQAVIYGQSEEHGHVDFSQCPQKPQIGERVTVIPNHCCVVSNLFNQIVGVRHNQVEVIWPVAARGALQ
jgi:D-serine deaminase-like pyridoxal phosphate-dependent protein